MSRPNFWPVWTMPRRTIPPKWRSAPAGSLGLEFFDAVDAAINQILDPTPFRLPRATHTRRLTGATNCREALPVPRRLSRNEVSDPNPAIAHDRRKPGYWKSRLE